MNKIVHLTSVHPHTDVRIFHKECLTLKKQGFDVTLVAPGIKDCTEQGINIVAVSLTSSRIKRMTVVLWQVFRKALQLQADIYHFHDPELIMVGLLLHLYGKRVVYDVHEDVPRDILLKDWLPNYTRKPIAFLVEKIEHFAAKFFSGVVTVTPHIQGRFAKYHSVEIRNYPVIEEFQSQHNQVGDSLCYTGLINEQRGIYQMVQLAKKTQTKLLLAGSCASSIPLTTFDDSQIHHYGYVNRETLQTIYQQSFVGLALLQSGPTFNESLPIKLFEYMAAGLPVLASNFTLWRDIIEKHECGWCVDPNDLDHIADRILYLKNNKEIAVQMGGRARQAVSQYYNWHTQADKLVHFYQQILGQ